MENLKSITGRKSKSFRAAHFDACMWFYASNCIIAFCRDGDNEFEVTSYEKKGLRHGHGDKVSLLDWNCSPEKSLRKQRRRVLWETKGRG